MGFPVNPYQSTMITNKETNHRNSLSNKPRPIILAQKHNWCEKQQLIRKANLALIEKTGLANLVAEMRVKHPGWSAKTRDFYYDFFEAPVLTPDEQRLDNLNNHIQYLRGACCVDHIWEKGSEYVDEYIDYWLHTTDWDKDQTYKAFGGVA